MVRAETKRHEALQNLINRLAKQVERVEDDQLRSSLKVYLHSIKGKLTSLWLGGSCDSLLLAEYAEGKEEVCYQYS